MDARIDRLSLITQNQMYDGKSLNIKSIQKKNRINVPDKVPNASAKLFSKVKNIFNRKSEEQSNDFFRQRTGSIGERKFYGISEEPESSQLEGTRSSIETPEIDRKSFELLDPSIDLLNRNKPIPSEIENFSTRNKVKKCSTNKFTL